MIAKAASRLQQFFGRDRKKNEEPPRHTRTADSTTRTMRALCDVGESIVSNVHVIESPTRLYLCVSMEVKPDALAAQMEKDRKTARGMFEVDENWSAAEVNARWARHAVLTDEHGEVLEHAVIGARGMTDAGYREVFFEFNAMDVYPEKVYLASGNTRVRVR